MFHTDGCALLIGIDEYRAFDRSLGNPEGTSDLAGSVLDAHVFFRLCTQLGMKPENIRVITSPKPDLSLFPGATAQTFGEGTEQGIRAAVGWLADKLAGGRAGLLTYSGHGAHKPDKGLLLCPSDTAGAGFDHAIPFHDLRAALGGAAENLTVVLDCCHGGAPAKDARGRRALTLGGAPLPAGDHRTEMMIGARVLAACQPGEMTQQASFSGMAHGAFTWALSAAVDQWKAVDQGGNVRMDLSYGTLIEKSKQLLSVLEFQGTPALYGPKGAEDLAVLQVGSLAQQTTAKPDGVRRGVQCDPGQKDFRYYTFKDITGVCAYMLVAKNAGTLTTNNTAYATGVEYWIGVRTTAPSTTLTVTWDDYNWKDTTLPTPGATSFKMDQAVTWSEISSDDKDGPNQGTSTFYDATDQIVLKWELTCSNDVWGGTLKWFQTGDKDNLFAGTMPAGGVVLTANVSIPGPPGTNLTWKKSNVGIKS